MDSHSTLGSHSLLVNAAQHRRAPARVALEAMAMCGVMCIGSQLLSLAAFSGLGASNLLPRWPALAVLIITASLIVPMAIYMGIRGHGRRHNLTMNAVTLAVGLVVMVLFWLAVLRPSAFPTWQAVWGIVCAPACLAMFVQVFVQRDMYAQTMRH